MDGRIFVSVNPFDVRRVQEFQESRKNLVSIGPREEGSREEESGS